MDEEIKKDQEEEKLPEGLMGGGLVDILGTEYAIMKLDYSNYKDKFANRRGWCDNWSHMICYEDLSTNPHYEKELQSTKINAEKAILRHEIVHAFLCESGLVKSHDPKSWADDEEIVDWIATQGPKIYKVWEEAGALEEEDYDGETCD